MPELSFPFNSNPVDGKEDRLYDAMDFAAHFKQFIGNGVYPNPSNGLRVDASGASMVLTVHEGSAFINGHTDVLYEEPLQFALSPAHMSYNRKDAIVVQLNHTERAIGIKYKEGIPAPSPIVPVLIRTDDIYELRLAEILVRSGVKQLTQADVTDTRMDGNLCGMVTNVVKSVDTTALFNQYQTELNQRIGKWNATEAQQGRSWQSQMTTQQTGFTAQMKEIEGIYTALRTDISKLQTFDFDNLCAFLGCILDTESTSTGHSETVTIEVTGERVAKRITEKQANGSMETVTAYEMDGVTIMKEFVITTTKTAKGFRGKVSGVYAPPTPIPPNTSDTIKAGPNMGLKLMD